MAETQQSRINDKRASIQIVADILKLGEARKTELMYNLDLRSSQAGKYLDFLLRGGFVRRVYKRPGVVYRTTLRGQGLLFKIEKVSQLLGWDESESETCTRGRDEQE
jgi:predicted transcriptional regulator